jgi:hypothetical protein
MGIMITGAGEFEDEEDIREYLTKKYPELLK